MSQKSSYWRKTAAFAAALSFFAATNLTPAGVLAAEISEAVSKKTSVTAQAVPAVNTPQDEKNGSAETQPVVTGTTAAKQVITTTTTAVTTTTTTAVQTTTTPAPKEEIVNLTFTLSFGDLDGLISNKNNLIQNLCNQLRGKLIEKENQEDKTFYGINADCNWVNGNVTGIKLSYTTYDKAAAKDIFAAAVADGLTQADDSKYCGQFSVDQDHQKISCENAFCRLETENNSQVTPGRAWASGETVTWNEGKELYVKYGLQLTEKQFKVNAGYYLERVPDANAGQNNKPADGITVKDTVKFSNNGISVGGKQVYQLKDCMIKLTVNTDNSVKKNYAPESFKWSELNANQKELKFEAATDDNDGVEIRADNNNKYTIKVDGKKEKTVKLKELLIDDLGYKLDTLSKQKETVINLSMTAMPKLFAINIAYEGVEESDTRKVLQKDGCVQIPLLIKRDGADYYLKQYTVKRWFNPTDDDPVDLTWAQVCGKLSSGSSCEKAVYWSDRGIAQHISTVYQKVSSTENDAAVKQMKSLFFGASQVNRNDNVMTWDFKKAFYFDSDSDLSKMNAVIVGSDGDSYQGKFQEIVNKDPDAETRYRLLVEIPKEKTNSMPYLRVQALLDGELSKSPHAYEGFEPFYIYVDHQAPVVSDLANSKKYKYGWSNVNRFDFSFSVSDDENGGKLTQATDDLEALEQINLNKDLASVKEIRIGDLIFARPKDGWGSGAVTGVPRKTDVIIDEETGETELQPVTTAYSITLNPDTDEKGACTGKFTGTFTLTSSDTKYFNADLPLIVTDYCGLESAPSTVKIRIDTVAPTVESLTIDSLTDGRNGERVLKAEAGKDLIVHADVTDVVQADDTEGKESSNIRSVRIQYAKRDAQEANDVKDPGWKGQMKFEADDISRSGFVAVTVEDYAGNCSTYYYGRKKDADAAVPEEADAVPVVTDFQAPAVPEFTALRDPDYFDQIQGKKWYQNYLNMPFSATDEGVVCSEIRTLKCRINDSDWCAVNLYESIDADLLSEARIAEQLAAGRFYLTFEPDTKNNRAFHVYLCCQGISGIRIPLSKDLFRLRESGKLTVEMHSFDHAGNQSGSASQTVYIDNTDPSADTHFTAETHRPAKTVAQTLFGVFSSAPIHVKVKISDTDGSAPSSGIQKAELIFAGTTYTGELSPDQTVADFRIPDTLPDQSCVSGTVTVRVTDMVGRTYESESLLSEKESTLIMLENKAPVLSDPVVEGPNRYVNDDGEAWFSGDVKVTYSVSDPDSGIADVAFDRLQKNSNRTEKDEEEYAGQKQKTTSGTYTLQTAEDEDGQADFKIRATDNAGNYADDDVTVYKDVSKPYVSGFRFLDARSFEAEHSDNIVEQLGLRYGHFSQKDTVLQVTVRDDRGASAGIRSVSCALYQPDHSLFSEPVTQTADQLTDGPDGSRIAYFVLPEGFKGDIAAWTADNVGNTSDTSAPDGFAAEDETRHHATSRMTIALPQTEKRDVSNLPLYNYDVTAELTVEDSFSGIRRIEWSTSDLEGWESAEIDRNGETGGIWKVEQKDRNLAVRVSAALTVTKDANADFIRLRIEDNAGNISEEAVSFSIDKQAPHIMVGGLAPSQQTAYYNRDITANVEIAERNFAAPTVNGTIDGGFNADPNSPENTDRYIHAKQFVYNTDGTYSLTVDNTDLAGNVTDTPFRSGEFVIDKTAPKAVLSFRRKNGGTVDPKKEPYISDAVSATFTVTELNFDLARAVVTINGQNYMPDAKDWKNGQNNVHVLTIPAELFTENRSYTVAASVTDMAGNTSGTVAADFVVDTVNPAVELSGFSAANKDRVAPVIRTSDENYADWQLKLTRNGEECEISTDPENGSFAFTVPGSGKTISGRWESLDSGKTVRFLFDDCPHEEAFDGAYELTASAVDQSGRKTSETGKFTVNRFGSVFTVTDYEEIHRKHIPQPRDIEIVERNVDLHAEGSEIIVVADKGSATVQLTENDYRVSEAVLLADRSGYEYTYTIKAENFSQDLDYKITISTTDAAGNANVSTNRGAELDFTVDTHVPEFTCDDLFDRAEYRDSEKQFRLNVTEPLRSIRVTTSDNEVLLDQEDDGVLGLSDTSFSFAVPASNSSRMITVEMKDLAGNVMKREFENLLVTENMALYMLHKTWVRNAGAGGLAGIAGIGAFLGIRKAKKKKNEF